MPPVPTVGIFSLSIPFGNGYRITAGGRRVQTAELPTKGGYKSTNDIGDTSAVDVRRLIGCILGRTQRADRLTRLGDTGALGR